MFFFKNKYKELSDQQLIDLIKSKKSDKYSSVLFERYAHLVFGVCLKYLKNEFDSKDAVLEIFEKALPYILKSDIQNFKSWLFTTSKNHCLMIIRSNTTQQKREEAYQQLNHTTEYDSEKEEKLQLLEQEIENLSPQQKECIKLFYFEQKSYAKIVGLTGYDIKQVKSYIQNAKRNLKLKLEKQDEFNI